MKNINDRQSSEVCEHERMRQELEKQLRFERLLTDIATRFVAVSGDRLDAEIKTAQKQICECLGIDVCALWQYSMRDPELLRMTHIYAPADFPAPAPSTLIARESFPWCLEKFKRNEAIILSNVMNAPPEAEQDLKSWQYFGIRSSLVLPLFASGEGLFSALGFAALKEEREWPADLINRLQLVAQIFSGALVRKKTEDALRESEARLSLAAESADAGLWSWDHKTGKIWVTDKTRSLYGFLPQEEISGERFFNALLRDDIESIRLIVERAFRDGGVVQTEYRVVLPDKRIRWISVQAQVFMNSAGEPDRMMGVSLDITERKQTELALAESEERYRMLFESAPAGIALIGADGYVRSANLLQARLYGYESPRQLEGMYAPLFVAEKDREHAAQNMKELLQGKEMSDRSYTAVRRDGTEFLVEVTSVTLRGTCQEVQGYLCMTRDITERKQNEIDRASLRLELSHIARVMTMNELSTSLAHEINQPLGAILNNASAARLLISEVKDKPEDIREILEDIVKDAKRAGDVVRKIRGFVKKDNAQFEPLDMNSMIEDVVALFQNSISINKVSLLFDLEPSLTKVRGDRVRLQQVLVNLITNALDALSGSPSKILTIRSILRVSDQTVTVSVCDSGPGIDDANREKIFDSFFTTKKEGLGMGLRICKSIIEEHEGRIWAENNPAGGATLSFSLKVSSGETV